MLTLSLVSCAFAEETEVSWGCFGTGDAVGYLLIALMLLMLLFMRVHRRERSLAPPRIPRGKPRSLDELGRAIFDIVQRDDVQAYRGLFLLGLEVQKALGDQADAYIAGRRPGMFETSLAKIAARVPSGATFDGTMIVGRDALALRLQTVTGGRTTVIVGTVTKVDEIYRMVHPGFVEQQVAPTASDRARR
jgi:hypothetical protein